jgi:hypothetical protein
LYVLGLLLFRFIVKKVDPPIGFVGLITIFAAILQQHLQEAINIKSEYDLTVCGGGYGNFKSS